MNESLVVHSAILYLHEQQKKIHNNNKKKTELYLALNSNLHQTKRKLSKMASAWRWLGNDVPLNVKTSFSLPLVKHQ